MTPTNDMINGAFEFSGALFLFRNCWTLYRDKVVKGVSAWATFYFFSWGIWNLFFYPALHQYWSWVGGMCICVAHFTWIVLLVRYRLAARRQRAAPLPLVPTGGENVH
ncbi:hypothetical protein [Paraburkholderia youngii]|uniref:hypothetical protein n=1 Tax=Paraburkholderia youngii TaxID=2782701 RepID=UPI003D21B4E9